MNGLMECVGRLLVTLPTLVPAGALAADAPEPAPGSAPQQTVVIDSSAGGCGL
ncbi:hypothetical protein [Duganella sp. P38]|uniref:hypothetical protein n=1 Tax=Duganella sp. P38 TaxID=3423949 RepID=UPI003D7B3D08